ncbi:MAG: penicillin-binding protein 2 [Pantoea sp. Brub]|nr:penicillin-binding protein 2 [Pantoea sp. Brub]
MFSKKKNSFFDKSTIETKKYLSRMLLVFFSVVLFILILLISIYKLQVLDIKKYNIYSSENRIQYIPIESVRGLIYDRNGIPLAINKTLYRVELIPNKINDLDQTILHLSDIFDISDKDIKIFKNKLDKSFTVFNSIPIIYNVNEHQIAKFYVNKHLFPEVLIKSYPFRYYPFGKILTHIVGYVGKFNNDINIFNIHDKYDSYSLTSSIGKTGIEAYYEDLLHGINGYREIETNNHHFINKFSQHSSQPGYNIYLTIDLKIQQYIASLLVNTKSSVIVSDPQNGDILAMVSNPSYDPNLFIDGISVKDYNNLLHDINHPLYNRSIQATYPPASTVKPYIAISALSSRIINDNDIIFDPGWWHIPNSKQYYRDWKKSGHGYVDIIKSIEESSDTFFYQTAHDMGIDRLSRWMTIFGYGIPTGIDLPQENSGTMPSRKWKTNYLQIPWYKGDTIPIGIGQGFWTATPMQMNKSVMILVNNGVIRNPHILHMINNNCQVIPYKQLNIKTIKNINNNYWYIVKKGMYGVANNPKGTAYRYFINAPYKIAAKSGTAQIFSLKKSQIYNSLKLVENLRDHKLMTAFAPYDKPRVVVTIIMENGTGPKVGIIMRKILDFIILKHNENYEIRKTHK